MSDHIPTELITKILSKLPVKSLIRFTVVCKDWRSLIKSPYFIAYQLSNPRNQTSLLLFCYEILSVRQSFSFLKLAKKNGAFCVDFCSQFRHPYDNNGADYITVVGVCNGVICFTKVDGSVFLWNPSIKTLVCAPEGIVKLKKHKNNVTIYGFGVDDDDYKVVRVVYTMDHYWTPEVEIFSHLTGVWRKKCVSDDVKYTYGYLRFSPPVFLNGVVHWIVHDMLFDDDGFNNSVLAFRLADEVFYEIKLPDELVMVDQKYLDMPSIVESLMVIEYNYTANSLNHCDVWSMKNVESWNKLYRMQFDLVDKRFWKVYGFCKSGEVLVGIVGKKEVCPEIAVYKKETRQITGLNMYGNNSYVHNFDETLVLLGVEKAFY